MAKFYFVNCAAFIDNGLKTYAELSDGTHMIPLLPTKGVGFAAAAEITVKRSGLGAAETASGIGCKCLKYGEYFIVTAEFPEPLFIPRVESQKFIGGLLVTVWRGARRYVTAENADNYCTAELDDGVEYSIEDSGGGVLLISGGGHVLAVGNDCDLLFDVHGDYQIDGRIQTVRTLRGVVTRTILENYSLSGALTGRKIIKDNATFPDALRAHAFIECFIAGDFESARAVMTPDLLANFDATVGFIGQPRRIIADGLPLIADTVAAEYLSGVKIFTVSYEDGLVADVDCED